MAAISGSQCGEIGAMKKLQYIICTGLLAVFLLPSMTLACDDCGQEEDVVTPGLAAEAAILIDEVTGKVLYHKNADQPLFPASTTKILTSLLVLEHAELDENVLVGEEITRIGLESSTAKLNVGDNLSVAELIYALLLPSGNDAAYTAAVFVARKASGFQEMDVDEAIPMFMEMMNQRARELGAENSNFVVPDGYHTPGHVSTARDLALISLEVGRHDFIRQVVSTPEFFWQGIRWPNTNRMLQQDYPQAYYPWATGFKTGYTPEAGFCLVATASGDGRNLLGVIMNSTRDQRWIDSRLLLEYGFNAWRNYEMMVEGRQVFMVPVSGQRRGEPDTIEILAGGTYSELLHIAQIARIELVFDWAKGMLDTEEEGLVLKAPIREGDILGQALVVLDSQIIAEVNLVAAHGVRGVYWWIPAGGAFVLTVAAGVLLAVHRSRRKSAAA